MPIFEYKCKKCGHKMEFLEKTDAGGRHKCEQCGSSSLQKLFSTFASTSSEKSGGSDSCPTGTCPLS